MAVFSFKMSSPTTFYQRLLQCAIHRPDAPAILSQGKSPLTYGGLSQHIQSAALQLTRMGIHHGDRVAVIVRNGPKMATAFLAISSVLIRALWAKRERKIAVAIILQQGAIAAPG